MNIKHLTILLYSFGLVILLLLSPCKIRNFVQAELGIPQTEVANKNQTHLTPSHCSVAEGFDDFQLNSKVEIKLLVSTNSERLRIILPKITSTPFSFQPFLKRKEALIYVPLYILYKNFKDDL